MIRGAACLLCGLLALVPAHAAQPVVALRVAWVTMDRADSNSPMFAAFREGLASRGYVEGKDLFIEAWWGDGSEERLEKMAGDILRAQPNVIVAQGGSALSPLVRARVAKPIVFGMSADPVAAKVAASYGHPGGNVTGITLFGAELGGKRLALLQEIVPNIRRVAVVANAQHPGERQEWQSAQAAAAKLGLVLTHYPVRNNAELDAALATIAKSRIEAVVVFSDGLALDAAERIAAFSLQTRIPVVSGWAPFAERGNLITYGPEFTDVYRRLAGYVDRIYKGAKPGDLPIEQPTKFELVVNQRTASAIGLTIPQLLLLRADEVIP